MSESPVHTESAAPRRGAEQDLSRWRSPGVARRVAGGGASTSRSRSWGPADAARARCLHLLGGLDRPTEGEVYFRGTPLSRIDRDQYRAREIGFVFQSFHLLPRLTAVENVQVPMFETTLEPSAACRARGGADRSGRPGPSPEPPSDARSRSASASESPSPAPWPMSRPCSWPTSRPATSTAGARTRSSNSSTTSVSDKA